MNIPNALSRIVPDESAVTPPILSLLGANIITILFAILGSWDAATVMFIYWAQSVIIGIFTVISLLTADTAILASEMGASLKESGGSDTVSFGFVTCYKALLAGFFALHYGLFHWGYLGFIVDTGLFGTVDLSNPDVWIACGLFFANHSYSFLYHRHDVRRGSTYVNEQFFRPYLRIFPMHLTIIIGAGVMLALTIVGIPSTLPVLVLFLVLKTYMDVDGHIWKHQEGREPAPML